ncbi:MAG: hypothetical protein IJN81_04130, partial [Clostridia bacterium]|nr:hypothetical protein [Clostridia bacterium]
DLKVAYEALDARFVDASAIAEAITAYGTTEYAEEYYDADEYAAYTAALAAANDADFTGKPDTQANRDAVAKIADDLKVAFEALDARFVDLTPIADALEECVPAYAEEYYDAQAWADYEAAVEAATTIFEGYKTMADTQEYRGTVADAAQAIRDAYAALVPQFVSYEKLEKAVADYAQPEHPEFYYTPDSWAAYEEALAAAKDVNENRPEPLPAANDNNQAAVDAYADALEKAYNELEAAVCHVISVTPLQEKYAKDEVINLSILVEGTATKVRLIRGTNSTSTYERTHSAVVSITDNGDGTETWVIARRVYEEEYTERAKAKQGKVWDTGEFAYVLKCADEDTEVKSVEVTLNGEAVETVTVSDLTTITIVTGSEAQRIRLVNKATGGTLTYKTPTSVNEDGTKVWVIVKQFYQVNDYIFDIYVAGSDNVCEDSGEDIALKVVTALEAQVPSTGNIEDAFFSAEVAKARLLRGATQTFTFTTDKDAKYVRIIDEDGAVFKTIKAPSSVEGDIAVWVCECTYNSVGERNYTAEALYGDTWIADADSAVSFTVIY